MSREQGVVVVADVEGERLRQFRIAIINRRCPCHALRRGVFIHRLVAARGEAGRIVDWVDRDDEGLRGGGIDPAVGGAAVVSDSYSEIRRAVGIGCRRICQAAGAVDRRLDTEQGGVAHAAHRIVQHGLGGFIGRAG